MHILLVAFEYPPLNTGGARRPQRLRKGLTARGHRVTVWTADYRQSALYTICDTGMPSVDDEVKRIPMQGEDLVFRIQRTGYTAASDGYWRLWKRSLRKAWEELLRADDRPDVILLTLPPFSLFRFARWVKNESSIPLVVDLRDHWSLWMMTPYASRLHARIIRMRERELLTWADGVVVVTPVMKRDLQAIHPGLVPEHVQVVTNAMEKLPEQTSADLPSRIRIGYLGAFYYFPQVAMEAAKPWYLRAPHRWFLYSPRREDWKYRSPWYFFRIVHELFSQHPEWAGRIELQFAGRKPAWFDQMVEEWSLGGQVVHWGQLDAAAALRMQDACSILLITSVKVEGGDDYCIAGKTFEFLSSGKRIIGCVTRGAQRDVLEQSGMALCIDPDDPAGAAERLHNWLLAKAPCSPQPQVIARYALAAVAEDMEHALVKAISSCRGAGGS
ncbi:MAG: glycosyltransferase [Bacteroidota bacterium]